MKNSSELPARAHTQGTHKDAEEMRTTHSQTPQHTRQGNETDGPITLAGTGNETHSQTTNTDRAQISQVTNSHGVGPRPLDPAEAVVVGAVERLDGSAA